ncbi:MAG: PTS sugar transporter subunit IIB [Coprobacillaceae bacterium]
MYKILICCSAGMTSSMLVSAVKEEATKQDVEVMVWTAAKTAVSLSWADADCILLAPQIASALSEIKDLTNGKVPVEVIDSEKFSNMDGKAVLKQALSMMSE